MGMAENQLRYLADVSPDLGESLTILEGVTHVKPGRLLCSAVGLLHLSERGTLFRCPKGAVVIRNGQMICFDRLGPGGLSKT